MVGLKFKLIVEFVDGDISKWIEVDEINLGSEKQPNENILQLKIVPVKQNIFMHPF